MYIKIKALKLGKWEFSVRWRHAHRPQGGTTLLYPHMVEFKEAPSNLFSKGLEVNHLPKGLNSSSYHIRYLGSTHALYRNTVI